MTPEAWIQTRTGARSAHFDGTVQSLWQGYGRIERWRIDGGVHPTVILKVVRPPSGRAPDTNALRPTSSKRPMNAMHRSSRTCTCGHPPRSSPSRTERWLFEDLDPAASRMPRGLDAAGLRTRLDWLAGFHARFLGEPADGLGNGAPTGTSGHDPKSGTGCRQARRRRSRLDAALAAARARPRKDAARQLLFRPPPGPGRRLGLPVRGSGHRPCRCGLPRRMHGWTLVHAARRGGSNTISNACDTTHPLTLHAGRPAAALADCVGGFRPLHGRLGAPGLASRPPHGIDGSRGDFACSDGSGLRARRQLLTNHPSTDRHTTDAESFPVLLEGHAKQGSPRHFPTVLVPDRDDPDE